MTGTDLTGRERVLRRWLIALATIAGVMLILVMAVVLYWLRFVLPTEPDPLDQSCKACGASGRVADSKAEP